MYIIKLNHSNDQIIQPTIISPKKHSFNRQNIFNQYVSKKHSFLSQRPHDTEKYDEEDQYSQSFREMMNKVLSRICKKNNFIKPQKRNNFNSLPSAQSLQQKSFDFHQSIDNQSRISKTQQGHSKLKIKGIGRVQNQSNLLKKNNKPKVFNKTSNSFVKNKQFRKSIEFKKAKSLSSDGRLDKLVQKQKQNSNRMNRISSYTFNNTIYSKQIQLKNQVDQSLKVAPFMPKIMVKQNYQKIHQLFKKQNEPKPKKIQIAKKLFYKKMAQRQIHNEKMKQQNNKQIIEFVDQKQKDEFEPWNTQQDFNEDLMFKNSNKKIY